MVHLSMESGSWSIVFCISTLTMAKGILVPNIHDIDDIDISGVSWVLVIEKEVQGSYPTAKMSRLLLTRL